MYVSLVQCCGSFIHALSHWRKLLRVLTMLLVWQRSYDGMDTNLQAMPWRRQWGCSAWWMNMEYQVLCFLEHRHLSIKVIKPVFPCTPRKGGSVTARIHGKYLTDLGGLEFPSGSGWNQIYQSIFPYGKESISVICWREFLVACQSGKAVTKCVGTGTWLVGCGSCRILGFCISHFSCHICFLFSFLKLHSMDFLGRWVSQGTVGGLFVLWPNQQFDL